MHAGNWYGLIRKKTYLGVSRCNRQKQLVSKAAINNYQIISHDRSWAPLGISTHQKEFVQLNTEMLRNGALNKPAKLHIFVLPRDLL